MPNTKSATRRARLTKIETARNRGHKVRVKTRRRAHEAAVLAGKPDEINAALQEVFSVTDKAVKAGTIHRRTADRIKSRATKKKAPEA